MDNGSEEERGQLLDALIASRVEIAVLESKLSQTYGLVTKLTKANTHAQSSRTAPRDPTNVRDANTSPMPQTQSQLSPPPRKSPVIPQQAQASEFTLKTYPENFRNFIALYRHRPTTPKVMQVRGVLLKEVNLREGDLISIQSELRDDGYYVGHVQGSRRLGLIPGSFIEPIDLSRPAYRPEIMTSLRSPAEKTFAYRGGIRTQRVHIPLS